MPILCHLLVPLTFQLKNRHRPLKLSFSTDHNPSANSGCVFASLSFGMFISMHDTSLTCASYTAAFLGKKSSLQLQHQIIHSPLCTWEELQVVDEVAVPSIPTGEDNAQLAGISPARCHHHHHAMCSKQGKEEWEGVLGRNEESAKNFWSGASPMRSGMLYNFRAMLAWWYIKRRFSKHSLCLNAAPVILCQTTGKLASIILPPKRYHPGLQLQHGRYPSVCGTIAGQLPIAQPLWSFWLLYSLFP